MCIDKSVEQHYSLRSLKARVRPGDVLELDRGLFHHWAIVYEVRNLSSSHISDDTINVFDHRTASETPLSSNEVTVIHFFANRGQEEAEVQIDRLDDVFRENMECHEGSLIAASVASLSSSPMSSAAKMRVTLHRCQSESCANRTISRALDKLGHRGYSVLSYNCEHFVRECVEGQARSSQVHTTATVAAVAALGVAILAGDIACLVRRGRR